MREPESGSLRAVRLARHAHSGEVYTCPRCRQIHLVWKNLAIGMSRGEFIRFAQMVGSASEHPAFGIRGDAALSGGYLEEPEP